MKPAPNNSIEHLDYKLDRPSSIAFSDKAHLIFKVSNILLSYRDLSIAL